ncbi:coiled-coil domain-containing protein 39 [Microcaecilia unicolor]|uniref:Coiled-coil domain-containing protein 39 n=1 Tax=Microcaecilia unicolor TaxID=1415580 RepID=A0A6P7Z5E8_9AMPH|nr:coiled-coil domain-containing protein 39 [Microcaecilia unicolor]
MSSEVLAELEWDDGFAIPVANAENKALEDELKIKQEEKTTFQNQLNDFVDRIQAMTEHMKNVRQELTYTQSLCRARDKEIETEQHFKMLAEREIGRLKQEILKLENEQVTLRTRKNGQENTIFKSTQKLEELKLRMNWDQQALEAWIEESSHRDDDALTILKYSQKDDSKIKDLSLQIEKLTTEVRQKRKQLDNEFTETITAQIELDKAAEDFRRVHCERQELLNQWESMIEQMQRRDQEIDHCTLLLAHLKQEQREKEAMVKERLQFLNDEIENNKEYEKKITTCERQTAKIKQDYYAQENNRIQLQDELDCLKATVDRTASQVEATRAQITNLKKEIQEKSKNLSLAKEYNLGLVEKLKFVADSALSEEEKSIRMEEILKEEQQAVTELDVQLKQLRELNFKRTQESRELENTEKNITAEINGCRATLKNLNNHLHKVDLKALKQQELIYNQDFQIQQLERRLARLNGDVNTDDKMILEAKIAELTRTLEGKRNALNLISTQHKKIQGDISHIKKFIDKTGEEKKDLMSKMEEFSLYNHMAEKELKKIRSSKQNLMVEDNIRKLEIKRLRDMLYNKADDVYSLEKRKLQLQTAMNERTQEIKVHKEMLQSQLRLVESERQNISLELHERLARIEKMKKRYEIFTIKMMPPEGEEDKSQAYYIIKAAQAKDDLQREGDDLDAKIRKTEKEIAALQNTLQVVNSCNTSFRKSFSKVTETSEEYVEKLQLEEQKRAAEEKYRYKRRQIKELQEDTQSLKNTLENMLKEEVAYHGKTDEKLAQIIQLNKETDEQTQKYERVTKQCLKLVKDIRSMKKTKEETQEEQDIDLRQLKDFNKSIDKFLVSAMQENPDLAAPLQLYFQQFGLELPVAISTAGSQSSFSSSSRSSVSSVRSSSRSSTSSSSSQHSPIKVVELSLPSSPTLSSSSAHSSRSLSKTSHAGSTHSRKSQK